MNRCARCGGRFPGPGIAANGRVYCCDKCAAGPSARNMLPMLPILAALIGAGAVLGWLAGRSRRSTTRPLEG